MTRFLALQKKLCKKTFGSPGKRSRSEEHFSTCERNLVFSLPTDSLSNLVIVQSTTCCDPAKTNHPDRPINLVPFAAWEYEGSKTKVHRHCKTKKYPFQLRAYAAALEGCRKMKTATTMTTTTSQQESTNAALLFAHLDHTGCQWSTRTLSCSMLKFAPFFTTATA